MNEQRNRRNPGPRGRGGAFIVLATGLAVSLVAGAMAGCGAPPLDGTQPSADALARQVLAAVARRDESRLAALAIDADEFERHVWPSLPAARPERNLPWSYVWSDLRQKSRASLRRMLGEYGGRSYELASVHFAGDATGYAGFRVHRATLLSVRDQAGATQELRLLGSMLEKDGQWKVFSYVVDQ